MYFYILERPKNSNTKRLYERIREYIGQIGILGEFALSSPARSPEEIAEMGIQKGYNTIVVIGSDVTVNKVAKVIAQHPSVVLGVIPIDEEQTVSHIIGTTQWKEACEILKIRRLKNLGINFLPPNKYFITDAFIYSEGNISTTININDQYLLDFNFTKIIIRANLTLEIYDEKFGNNLITQKINWFLGRHQEIKAYSVFHPNFFTLTSKKPLFIVLNNEVVARSPLRLDRKENLLKIIIKNDTIVLNSDKKEIKSTLIR